MIDAESRVFTEIRNAVKIAYPNAVLDSIINLSPAQFPFVSVEEINNQTTEDTADSGSNENHATVTYEINILSNKAEGKKAEAKAICALIDEIMLSIGFNRTFKQPLDMNNTTKYRIIVRYRATVSKDFIFYRR